MEKLLAYLNSLPHEDRAAFARRCETTLGYLRKACSVNQKIGEGLCLRIGTESGGAVKPQDLRPDVDWKYLSAALANAAQPAIEVAAEKQPLEAPAPDPLAYLDHGERERRERERRAHERRAGDDAPWHGVERRAPQAQPYPFPDLDRRMTESEITNP